MTLAVSLEAVHTHTHTHTHTCSLVKEIASNSIYFCIPEIDKNLSNN